MGVAVKVVGGVLAACACAGFFLGALDADTAISVGSAGAALLGIPVEKVLAVFRKKPEAPKE